MTGVALADATTAPLTAAPPHSATRTTNHHAVPPGPPAGSSNRTGGPAPDSPAATAATTASDVTASDSAASGTGSSPSAAITPGTEQVEGSAVPPELDPVEVPLLESLVAAAVNGEARAKERLLAEIHPMVLRYCRGRLGRQETVIGSADDVAQEVCLAVVSALPNYTIKGLSFRAFVYGIAGHKVTDAFRAIGRNRSEPMADLPDSPVLHDGPEYHLLAGELTERLGGLLHRLTPRQREVLILRIAVGLSAEETAHVVGSTPGAVRVTQHRALNRLRGVIAGPGEDEGDGVDEG